MTNESNELNDNTMNSTEASADIFAKIEPMEQVSPGKYTAEIIDVTLTQHVAELYDIVLLKLQIVDGRYAKETLNKTYHLKSEKCKTYLLKEFGILGVIINTRHELLQRYPEIKGKLAQIEVRNDNGNMSIYIQRDARQEIPKFDPASIWGKSLKAGMIVL